MYTQTRTDSKRQPRLCYEGEGVVGGMLGNGMWMDRLGELWDV